MNGQEMLQAWEAGRGRSLTYRAVLLLAAAEPEARWETLATLPIGERDARLLNLRERMFGPELSSLAECPACGEKLELRFTANDVRVARTTQQDTLTLCENGYQVEFRLPTSSDLLQVEGRSDARRELLRRCVQGAKRGGRKRAFGALPACVLESVVDRMSNADPQANVFTEVVCKGCAHAWRVGFDVASFLWEELEQWVRRMLTDVHILATAYGWREADILALSPWRRRFYLQLAHR